MADQHEGTRRGNDVASSREGTAALRVQLGRMIAHAARARMPWVVIGGLVLAFLLTFVLAPLLSVIVAAFVGAALQAALSRFVGRSGVAADQREGRRLGAMLAFDVRKHRQVHDTIADFAAVAGLVLLVLGGALALAAQNVMMAITLTAVFGLLFVLLVRR